MYSNQPDPNAPLDPNQGYATGVPVQPSYAPCQPQPPMEQHRYAPTYQQNPQQMYQPPSPPPSMGYQANQPQGYYVQQAPMVAVPMRLAAVQQSVQCSCGYGGPAIYETHLRSDKFGIACVVGIFLPIVGCILCCTMQENIAICPRCRQAIGGGGYTC